MDRWMDGQIDGWMDGCVDRWLDRSIARQSTAPAAPPPIIRGSRCRFLLVGPSTPPPIICRRAADPTLMCLIVLHFYVLDDLAISCCSVRNRSRHFVLMLWIQNSI